MVDKPHNGNYHDLSDDDTHDSTTDQLNDLSLSDNTTQLTKQQIKNRKKRDRLRAKKQQLTSGDSAAVDTNGSATATVDTPQTSLLLNDYFNKQPKKSCLLQYDFTRGRHLIATATIPRGNTLFTAQSYVNVVNDAVVPSICHHCMNTASAMHVCPHCNYTRFCSRPCQAAMADVHQRECSALQKLSVMHSRGVIQGESAPLRGVIRMLYHRHHDHELQQAQQQKLNQLSKSRGVTVKPHIPAELIGRSSAEAATLVSNGDKLDQQTALRTKQVLNQIANVVEPDVWSNADDAYHMYMQLRCNAHQIHTNDKRHIGMALYLPAAMMNHSCLPSCVYHYTENDKRQVMRTIRDVQAGDELTYAYTNLYDKRASRHEQLRQLYYVDTCQCDRCRVPLSESPDRFIEGYVCSKCAVPDTDDLLTTNDGEVYVCPKCSTEYTVADFNKIESTCQTILTNAAKVAAATKNVQPMLDAIDQKVLPKLYSVLHRWNVSVFNVRTLAFTQGVAVGASDKSYDHIKYCVEAMEAMQLHNHPELGSMYHQLAMAEQTMADKSHAQRAEHKKKVVSAWEKCVAIYMVCFGGQHALTKHATKQLKQCTG